MPCKDDEKGRRQDTVVDNDRLAKLADQGLNGEVIGQRVGLARKNVAARLKALGYVPRGGRWVRDR